MLKCFDSNRLEEYKCIKRFQGTTNYRGKKKELKTTSCSHSSPARFLCGILPPLARTLRPRSHTSRHCRPRRSEARRTHPRRCGANSPTANTRGRRRTLLQVRRTSLPPTVVRWARRPEKRAGACSGARQERPPEALLRLDQLLLPGPELRTWRHGKCGLRRGPRWQSIPR